MSNKTDASFAPVVFQPNTHRGSGVFISLDRQQRLMLSSQTRKMMNLSDTLSSWIAVFYDKASHRIAIQKEELVTNAPATSKTKIDARGYFNARDIVSSAAIDVKKLPLRYYYDGEVSINGERLYSFKLADK